MNNNEDILGNASDDEDESEEATVFQALLLTRTVIRLTSALSSTSEFFAGTVRNPRYICCAWVQEIIGKCSYGVVCSAIDIHIGEKVAIKKINDVFEHVSDATRILREIKLLRLLRHPDLHQVIKANDDLTPEHHQFC
ncbi:Mitogen-activated protein kinase 15 [Trifolium repens]|nr:Mitogen-activated protein kinase 15 [Trifolium repens]